MGAGNGSQAPWKGRKILEYSVISQAPSCTFTTNFIHLNDSILKSQDFCIFKWKTAELMHLLARNHEKIPGPFLAFETGSGYLELQPLFSVSWDRNYKCMLHQRARVGIYMYLLKENWPNKFILHLSLNISHRLLLKTRPQSMHSYSKSTSTDPLINANNHYTSDKPSGLLIWQKCIKGKLATHLFNIWLYVQPQLDCVCWIPADCSSLLPQSFHAGTPYPSTGKPALAACSPWTASGGSLSPSAACTGQSRPRLLP